MEGTRRYRLAAAARHPGQAAARRVVAPAGGQRAGGPLRHGASTTRRSAAPAPGSVHGWHMVHFSLILLHPVSLPLISLIPPLSDLPFHLMCPSSIPQYLRLLVRPTGEINPSLFLVSATRVRSGCNVVEAPAPPCSSKATTGSFPASQPSRHVARIRCPHKSGRHSAEAPCLPLPPALLGAAAAPAAAPAAAAAATAGRGLRGGLKELM